MRILIIENVWMGDGKYGFFDKTLLTMFTILPSLNARQLAVLTPDKHEVRVLNERYEKIKFDEDWDLVNINFTTSTANHAYEISDRFRNNGITVVLSGSHPSLVPEEAEEHADSILLGLAGYNWIKLLDDMENGKLKKFYRPVKYNKDTYLPPTNIKLPGLVLTGAIEATRGCPFSCEFCREAVIPGASWFYSRPVNEVIEEIKNLQQKSFTFYDVSLTINPEYTKNLFKAMKGLKKRFSCNGNVDVLAKDKNLVRLSKEAGCVSWLIGFESFSQKTIININKKTNVVEEYDKAIKNIHNNKMLVIGCFIFGFDTDNPEIFKRTLKLIKNLEIDVADFLILTPFPGTPIYKKLNDNNRIINKNWNYYDMKSVVFKPKNMSSEELILGIRYLYKEFYSTDFTVRRIIRSFKYGFYPFLLVFERNFTSYMNRRKFRYK
jgi:radical SAM superfamily enzyme YgiQ (UPF0313 family)